MMKQIKYLCILLVMIFTSCDKSMPIDIPQLPKQLSVFSSLDSSNLLQVGIMYTYNSKQNLVNNDSLFQQLKVVHARVVLGWDGIYDTLTNQMNGFYTTNKHQFVQNKSYTLTVFDSITEQTIYASTNMLSKVNYDINLNVLKGLTDTSLSIKSTIYDTTTTKNFYMIGVVGATKNFLNLELYEYTGRFFMPDKLVLFTNEIKKDGKIESTMILTLNDYVFGSFQDNIIVYSAQISEEYYHYLEAYAKYNSTINGILQEPVAFPTNVEHGVGMFTMHQTSYRSFDLSHY